MGANFKKKRTLSQKAIYFASNVLYSHSSHWRELFEEQPAASQPISCSSRFAEKSSAYVYVISLLPWKLCHKCIVTSQQDGKGGECGLEDDIRNDQQQGKNSPGPWEVEQNKPEGRSQRWGTFT